MAMLLLRWIINALALLLTANVVKGFHVDSFGAALVAALILGLVNAVIRPVVILLTLPLTVLTLGLFTFVINAAMLLLVSHVVKGFTVDGWTPALLGSLLLWAISLAATSLLLDKDRR